MQHSNWITYSRTDAARAYLELAQFIRSLPADEERTRLHRTLGLDGQTTRSDRHNTERAYGSDQRSYLADAAQHGTDPLSPTREFWEAYFTRLATEVLQSGKPRRAGTIYRAAYGIGKLFDMKGLPSPTRTFVHRSLMIRLARTDQRSTRKARPLIAPDAVALVDGYGKHSLRALRDRAIAAFGVNRGFRSATIVKFRVQDIIFDGRGVQIGIREDKTSKTGETAYTVNAHNPKHTACLVCALREYRAVLSSIGITEGPLFRAINKWGQIGCKPLTTKSVTALLRKGLAQAGVSEPNTYSSHSYRHGVVHTAVAKGLSLDDIMLITLHRSRRGLSAYINAIDPWYFAPPQLDLRQPARRRSSSGLVHAVHR